MGEAIVLPTPIRSEIVAHARAEAPRECCGLLIGHGSEIDESVRVRNIDESPTRYLVDPAAHVATIRRLRGSGRSIVGCYHSHPHSPAVPSDTDLREALYDDFVWIIVSLADRSRGDVAAYRLLAGEFVTVGIVDAPGRVRPEDGTAEQDEAGT